MSKKILENSGNFRIFFQRNPDPTRLSLNRPGPIFFLRPPSAAGPPDFGSPPPRLAPLGGILALFMPQCLQQRAKKRPDRAAARPDWRRRFRPRCDRKLYGFCSSHSQKPLVRAKYLLLAISYLSKPLPLY